MLIVNLGILAGPAALLSMLGVIVLVTVLGWGLNLLLGTSPAPAKATD